METQDLHDYTLFPAPHEPDKFPVIGCKECDRIIGRPIQRCFGLGSSTITIPVLKKEANGSSNQA